MSTHRETFRRILHIIGLEDDDLDILTDAGISSLGLLLNFDKGDLPDTFNHGKLKSVNLFQKWLTEARMNSVDSNPIDRNTFTEDPWEEYINRRTTKNNGNPFTNQASSQGSVDSSRQGTSLFTPSISTAVSAHGMSTV